MSALSTLEATLPIDPRSPGLAEPMPEDPAGVLRSSIRVNHGLGFGATSPAGHLERVRDDLRGDPV